MEERRVRVLRWGVALLAATVLTLSGCAAETTPAPTPSAPTPLATTSVDAATPTPVATVVPESVASVKGLVVRPTAFEMRARGGALVQAFDYMSSPAGAVAALTVVFDGPPRDEPYPGTNHTPPGITHTWEGFVLDERFYDEARRAETGDDLDYVWPRFAVYFDAPAVRDIVLSSIQGFQAGDSWQLVSASPDFRADVHTCMGTPLEISEIVIANGVWQTAVIVVPTDEGSSVKWVGAPEAVVDGCA